MSKCICVIDGRGGGIGATVIKYLKGTVEDDVEVIAVGTSDVATVKMISAGANRRNSG